MAKLALYFLLQLSFTLLHTPHKAESTTPNASTPAEFVTNSCRPTRFPKVCVQCLSSFANQIQNNEQTLVQTALSVSLDRTKSAMVFLTKISRVQGIKPRESRALKDCYDNLQGSMDRLSQSINELEEMNKSATGADYEWHASNLQTWVSGALTNENMCLDGFARSDMDGNVKVHVRSTVLELARITSNALALCEGFASRHRPVGKP